MTARPLLVRALLVRPLLVRPLLVPPLLLALAACGGGTKPAAVAPNGSVTATGPSAAQAAEVDGQDTLKFKPNTVTAHVGTLRLTMRNAGQVPHNLEFSDAALGKTTTVNGGAAQVLTLHLAKPGTYAFVCTFHQGMTGRVVVLP